MKTAAALHRRLGFKGGEVDRIAVQTGGVPVFSRLTRGELGKATAKPLAEASPTVRLRSFARRMHEGAEEGAGGDDDGSAGERAPLVRLTDLIF